MILHFARITAITMLIVTCMFLPFIPGSYDNLAVTLSLMAQVFGMAGLLLVPIGLLWLIYESMKRTQKDWKLTGKVKSCHFAIAALAASIIVAIAVSLGAFGNNNRTLGIITLVFCAYIILKLIPKLRQMKNSENKKFNPTPFYLICIPLIVLLFRFMFIVPATEFSRNYAIKKSEKLIQDIEAYYNRTGHYPLSLLSVNPDYEPSVIGIKEYHYEPYGNAYNLYFEQFTYELDIKEIVMYNKLDEHAMSSHDMDILEYTGEELTLRRGDRRKYNLPIPHWKYIWFD